MIYLDSCIVIYLVEEHPATARHHQCTVLWTNDDRLKAVAGALAVNILTRAR